MHPEYYQGERCPYDHQGQATECNVLQTEFLGEQMPAGDPSLSTYMNVISGPSKTADIEKKLILGIRAENVHDEQMYIDMFKEDALLSASVDVVEQLGSETFLYMTCEESIVVARVNPRSTAQVGDTIQIVFDPNRFHIFDKETEKTIAN